MINVSEALDRWTEEILPTREAFEHALSEKKLTFYHGVDPTGPDLHLGHSTNYLLMRVLQDAGHKIILLIGTFTAKIGDPSDKTAARRRLDDVEIEENIKNYKSQASKILRFDGENPVEVRYNADWLSKLSFSDVIELAAEVTVQQMIERDIFRRRLAEQKPLYVHEFLYPLAQGYDSVAMDVDAEIGGTEQTFNMLVGRTLVKSHLNKEKFVVSTPLLINPKTNEKAMSKSLGNYIGINFSPNDMWGKIMALPDEMILPIFKYCTYLALSEIEELEKELQSGNLHPLEVKKQLARELVTMYYSDKEAKEAQEHFEKTFQKGEADFNQEVTNSGNLIKTLSQLEGMSASEVRRLLAQKAVDVDGKTVTDANFELKGGEKIKVGKRVFVKVV